MGLSDVVQVVEHDFTSETVFKHLPKQGTVDVVTMSYSLSMIPDKNQALVNASRLLKPRGDGILAVADFFLHGNHDEALPPTQAWFREMEAAFHKNWFAQDKVFLLDDQVFNTAKPALEPIWDNRFRGGVPFLPFLQPYHGVYMMSTTA
jgi:S-adenosylmethionine-diacylgycerolhomoserine-N-methlytransferase